MYEHLQSLLRDMVSEAQALGAMVMETENALPLAYYFRKRVPPDGVELLFGAVFEMTSGAIGDALSDALEYMGLGRSRPAEINVDFGSIGLIAKKVYGYLVGMLFSRDEVAAGLAILVFREHLEELERLLAGL